MFQQGLQPVGDSLALSALCAALPLLTLFVLLGGLRMKAWLAGVISLGVSLVVAVVLFGMPVGQSLVAAADGAAFGFFPILWIVINAIWVYNLTVASGHFDVLRRSFEKVSPDQRVQAIIIAFCFGALLEALAGFGTPVAITVVMLMALGFRPIKAAAVALIANTAPVAFGALATPIVTLAQVTSAVSDDPRLTVDDLGAMVGRQTPLLAVVVPLILVFVVDGRRGVRRTWLPALVCGVAFGAAQYVASNHVSVPLADIVAALVGAAAVVALLRVWSPAEVLTAEQALAEDPEAGDGARAGDEARERADAAVGREATGAGSSRRGSATGSSGSSGSSGGAAGTTGGAGSAVAADSGTDVARAYAPYLIIIAIFSMVSVPAVIDALAQEPFTYVVDVPGLDVVNPAGDPVATQFKLNWLPAAGTLMILAGVLTAAILRISPARAARAYVQTYVELRSAIVTVMAVLGLAYVMNLSGQTTSLGALLAETGGFFVVLSPILGWIGVAVTGSDTSANALFGALQVQTAREAGLDPLLLAAANTSGGVLGKMVSPQNLAIAAAAVGMAGREGDIFRKVIGWSLGLLVVVCLLVALQSTAVLGWMVPGA